MTAPNIDIGPRFAIFEQYAPAHPKPGPELECVTLVDALTRGWPNDVFLQACALEGDMPKRRLSGASLEAGITPSMALQIADLDPPGHEPTPAWRDGILRRCERLTSQPFGYWTRRGARLVWRRKPFKIDSPEAVAQWAIDYLLWGVDLAAAFDLVLDPKCDDWPHIQRLPHTTRDGTLQTFGWICGNPADVGTWEPLDLPRTERLAALGRLEATSQAWRSKAEKLSPPEPETKPESRESLPVGAAAFERARAYLVRCEPSIQGSNGSGALFHAAQVVVRGFALPHREALSLLREYNQRAAPPWPDPELVRVLKSAATKGTMERGSLLESRAA